MKFSNRENPLSNISSGQWLVLAGALLGWLFDGMDMGVFSLVGRSALADLLKTSDETVIGFWFGAVTAGFLVGAATGGVLFGWLGDRIGRVRAMSLSVLTYALFTGLCGLANSAEQIAACRFVAALGMGGEYALGVSLVMESWPDRSRVLLSGVIGAAGNAGYLVVALVGLGLTAMLDNLANFFRSAGFSTDTVDRLVSHQGWRLLMLTGLAPAFLTFLIRLFVPESASWEREKERGNTSHWATRDLLGVALGALGPLATIYLWAADFSLSVRAAGTLVGLLIALCGYLYPVIRYSTRLAASESGLPSFPASTIRKMLLAAILSGVALLGSWGAMQWAPTWADKLTNGQNAAAKSWTQICSASGAMAGCMLAALAARHFSRRMTYRLICIAAFLSIIAMYRTNHDFNSKLLLSVFIAGMCSASFYGWLPLYLPELFRTNVRAIGQGFGYNFGRILAAIGALQTGNLMGLFGGNYAVACSVMSGVYIVGFFVIQLAPETCGRPLPD